GDQQAMVAALLRPPEAIDLTPAPLASLDFVIRDAMERTGSAAGFLQITKFDSASAEIRLFMAPSPGGLAHQILGFDGVTRSFDGLQPLVGQNPSLGSSLFGIIRPLHFGDFAGLGSKFVWFGMGLAMAYVNATGMLLWTKRREEEPLWNGFRHWIIVTIWGLPFAMLVSAVVFFVAVPVVDTHFWTPVGFLAGVLLSIGLSLKPEQAPARLRLGNALLCLALPILRHLTGGTSWSEALIGGGMEVICIDFLLLLMGVVLLRSKRNRSRAAEPLQTKALQGPAA
ncbi:MAG: PepSY-associated TM helix domain-containing protein, partial [Pseudomonadota bacterium]